MECVCKDECVCESVRVYVCVKDAVSSKMPNANVANIPMAIDENL